MLSIIFCILTMGHLLSPEPWSWERYILAVGGVLVGVLGAYRINELHDRTTSTAIPDIHHKAVIGLCIITGSGVAIYLSWTWAWWIMALALIGMALMICYNAIEHPIIHNRIIYGLTWGALPLIFSEMTQGLKVPTWSTMVFGIWAGTMAVFTLWLWGPTTCGRMAVCARARGEPIDRLCHSPVLRCKERVVMPQEVHDHMKILISLNCAQVFLITFILILMKLEG
jgi:hypothetical protein